MGFVTDIISFDEMLDCIMEYEGLVSKLKKNQIFNLLFLYDYIKREFVSEQANLAPISQILDRGRANNATTQDKAYEIILLAVLSLKYLPEEVSKNCMNVVLDHDMDILFIRSQHLDSRHMRAICNILPCTHVTTLDVTGNHIGVGGANVLAMNDTLLSLLIANNNLGDEGVEAIARLSTLKFLDVRANNISSIGAIILAKNNKLDVLDIDLNNIDDPGMKALVANASFSHLAIDRPYSLAGYHAIKEENPVNRYNYALNAEFQAVFPTLKRQVGFFVKKKCETDDDFKMKTDEVLNNELKKFVNRGRI